MSEQYQIDQIEMGIEADAVLRLGLMHMGAGTSGYRVIRAMKRAARALGFTRLDVVLSVNTITCTFHRRSMFRTVVANHHHPTVDASRIEALEDLTHHLDHKVSVGWLTQRLDEIEEGVGHRWPQWVLALAAGTACAAFAVLNHFTLLESAMVAVAAALGQATRGQLLRRHFNVLGAVAVACAVACFAYFGAMNVVERFVPGSSYTAGYVAAALFVIPGFPLFSSLLDLARFDIAAGVSRFAYALTIMTSATISVSMVSVLTGMNPLPTESNEVSTPFMLVASFLGIAGFAFLFNSSKRMILIAATVGMLANGIRFALLDHGLQPQFAAFICGLFIGFVVAAIAKKARIPRITMTVPAAVIMIPGAAMYRSMYALNTSEIDSAIDNAATAALVVLFIAAGLVASRMCTDRDWAFGRLINFEKPLKP